MKNVGNSSRGRSQGVPKLQGTQGASRGHLCDSTAFLLLFPISVLTMYKDRVTYLPTTESITLTFDRKIATPDTVTMEACTFL